MFWNVAISPMAETRFGSSVGRLDIGVFFLLSLYRDDGNSVGKSVKVIGNEIIGLSGKKNRILKIIA